MNFTRGEASLENRDMGISIIALTIAFGIFLFFHGGALFDSDILLILGVSILSVITAFLLHQAAHRYAAGYYGGTVKFKLWSVGIAVAIMTAFAGIVLAVPGKLEVIGIERESQIGKTAVAGPFVNIFIGSVLYAGLVFFPPHSLVWNVLGYVGALNLLFGAFNMLPIDPFDGAKVIRWNFGIYILVFLIAIIMNVLFFRF